ncbi:MAG: M20 peptidase family dipeptidase, partial [Pseudomonadota bacterium]
MTRASAIQSAEHYFDSRQFHTDLARRVAMPTESQNPDRADVLRAYLADELTPTLQALGFT